MRCAAEDKRFAAARIVVNRRAREKTLRIDTADGMINGGMLDHRVGQRNQLSDAALHRAFIVPVGQNFVAWLFSCPVTDINAEIVAESAVNEPLCGIGGKENISGQNSFHLLIGIDGIRRTFQTNDAGRFCGEEDRKSHKLQYTV